MTYLKTIDNSEQNCPNETIVVCDECGSEFPTRDPHYLVKEKDFHLCTTCISDLAESFILDSIGWNGLYWLKMMEVKYFSKKKKKRSCYLPKKVREEILAKYKFTCKECGSKEDLAIDHIKPVALGGNDEPENLQVLCRSCNSKKGKKYE